MLAGILAVLVAVGMVASQGIARAESFNDPDKVAAVLAGTLTEANVAWWGFDPEDSTEYMQAAINSGASRVIIPDMGQDWIVRPITLRSNQELFFEEGAVVQAKKGEFHGRTDSLFTGRDVENVIFRGYGATLRMHKEDYDNPALYEKAEWRMGIAIQGSYNVQIYGLTIRDTGGDGIYLGRGTTMTTNENIIIRDIIADNNYRQGISVISAKNLLIENSVFKNTGGTAPGAGIDLEPNRPDEQLTNVIIRNSVFEDNVVGMLMYLKFMDSTSEEVSILWENNIVRGGNVGINLRWPDENGPSGTVVIRGCIVEDTSQFGVRMGNVSPETLDVRIEDCYFDNVAHNTTTQVLSKRTSPIVFDFTGVSPNPTEGGVSFDNVMVVDEHERPVVIGILQSESESNAFANITGDISAYNPYGIWNAWHGGSGIGDVFLRPVCMCDEDRLRNELLQRFDDARMHAAAEFMWPLLEIEQFDDSSPMWEPVIRVHHLDDEAITSVKVWLDESLYYDGSILPGPGEITVDISELADGKHDLIVTIETTTAGTLTKSIEFWIHEHLEVSGAMPLRNASFEDPLVNGTPPGWRNGWSWNRGGSIQGRNYLSISTEFASDGSHSFKMDGTSASGIEKHLVSEPLPAVAGSQYTASANIYASPAKDPHPYMVLAFFDGSGNRIHLKAVRSSGLEGQWENFSVTDTAPEGTVEVSVVLVGNTSYTGVTYWDEVSLEVQHPDN